LRYDPHIRDYNQAPPLIPGSRARFQWPEPYSPSVERIRNGVQDGGPGLFVLRTPDGETAVVEAYYPENVKRSYYKTQLDPLRRADHGDGGLVVINVLKVLKHEVNGPTIAEIRRNNRAFNPALSGSSSAYARKLEMEDMQEQDFQKDPEVSEFLDQYTDAALETRDYLRPANYRRRRL
jgi:hypothetical protein